MSAAPSCPLCGSNRSVAVLAQPVGSCGYVCDRCNLLFAGSDREWSAGYIGGQPLYRWRQTAGSRRTPQQIPVSVEPCAPPPEWVRTRQRPPPGEVRGAPN